MLQLHPLLRDHAVLQAGKPILLSGSAAAHATVEIQLGTGKAACSADAHGAWQATLPARPAGESLELVVTSGSASLTCRDLVTGEVWICSGQSNMEWTLAQTKGSEADIAAARDPLIRCFTVPRTSPRKPTRILNGNWLPATPQTAPGFSAVAWHFARRLRATTGTPVGLIVAAWGGSCLTPWLPRTALEQRPSYADFLLELDAPVSPKDENAGIPHAYQPRSAVSKGWERPEFTDRDWATLCLGVSWQCQGWHFNGAVWYRATVALPDAWRGRELILDYGPADDFDEAFVNGTRVGGIGPENPAAYSLRRTYTIPATLTTGGSLTLAIRVMDHWGQGGILGGGSLCRADDPTRKVNLPSEWKAKAEVELPLRMGMPSIAATEIYNGMIHPLLGYPLRGFLWYQGESDASRAQRYHYMLPDLIAAWRRLWQDPLAPFGIVQLAAYQASQPEPVESEWAELREAQRLTARTVPHTGLAVALDLGEADDIHPRFKKPVGERLAGWALATVYGHHAGAWAHPDLADCRVTPGALLVRLSNAGEGLRTRDGGAIRGFQIAGADRVWYWAQAERVEFDTLRLTSANVPSPVAARYGWQSNPDANLVNSDGLPATSFRTDTWPLTTAG